MLEFYLVEKEHPAAKIFWNILVLLKNAKTCAISATENGNPRLVENVVYFLMARNRDTWKLELATFFKFWLITYASYDMTPFYSTSGSIA